MNHSNVSHHGDVPYDPDFDYPQVNTGGVSIQIQPKILFALGFLFGALIMAIPAAYFLTRLFL